MRFLDNFWTTIFISLLFIIPISPYSEFPLSSSTHKQLFSFLLLYDIGDDDDGEDNEIDDEDDESELDLILPRTVTRSWSGSTLGDDFLFRLFPTTRSCINR